MKCPRCGNKMIDFTPISEERGILHEGKSCNMCGTWIEPKITPVMSMPPKEIPNPNKKKRPPLTPESREKLNKYRKLKNRLEKEMKLLRLNGR